MREYFTKNRIWYLIAFVVQLGCGFLIFPRHFSFIDGGDLFELSVPTFYESLGYSAIYTIAMISYFFMTAPLLFCGLMKDLKRWPLIFSLVVVSLFTLFNALLFTLVFIAGRQITDTFKPTVWFYLYVLVQLGTLINLIFMIIKTKPENDFVKQKR